MRKRTKVLISKIFVIIFLSFILIYLIYSSFVITSDEEFFDLVFYKGKEEISVCFNWSSCYHENYKERTCFFINYPGEYYVQKAYCDYNLLIHCDDDIKNYDETDIDCGGSCEKCDLNQSCNVNLDCKSSNCHPITNKCVLSDEKPGLLTVILFKRPRITLIVLIILPISIITVHYIHKSYKEAKIKIEQRNQDLVDEFYHLSKTFSTHIKNGHLRKAKETYSVILSTISKMDVDYFKKISEDFEKIKKIYKQIK